jgi:hypothetical protein
MTAHLNRRGFLQATGYLLLSFAIPRTLDGAALAQTGKLVGDLEDHPLLSSWLKIDSDNTVTLNGRVRVVRVVVANDSGQIISPDGIANQMEGGVIQSLSWTLKEEVLFDKKEVLSEDWKIYSYPILTFEEVPPIEVVLINRPGELFLGTGEAAQGPTAAALGNAVFDATGVRYRCIPFTPKNIIAGQRVQL